MQIRELNGTDDLDQLLAQAEGISSVVVGTRPENHGAQAMYDAWGLKRRDASGPRFML